MGETGAVDALEGGERDTNDLLSCSHYPLKGLAAGRVAGAIPHSDAASQDALDGASRASLSMVPTTYCLESIHAFQLMPCWVMSNL